MSLIDKTIGGHYRISELIGKGGFGKTYRGIDITTLDEVAVKAEPINSKAPQLANEYKLYKILAGGSGIPCVNYYGSAGPNHYMVMDLLGKSIEDLFFWCNREFSVKTVLMLADQMISCIEWIHRKNFIHRDIKPDNFMIGVNNKSNLVYLIDYGLMKHYRDPRTLKHIQYAEGVNIAGTARYASIHALSAIEQSRRDDLEGLGYVLAYLLRGSLPWMSVDGIDQQAKFRHMLEMKKQLTPDELFSGFPHQFVDYMNTVRKLKFDENPDYAYLRSLFREALIQGGFVYDYVYDWSDTFSTFSVFKTEESDPNIKRSPIKKGINSFSSTDFISLDSLDSRSTRNSHIKRSKRNLSANKAHRLENTRPTPKFSNLPRTKKISDVRRKPLY
ncbi:serine/threonine protein kinase [Tritrichomonas musculus]|uniref:non-specific serine/threonine protein kinase n=1 Tax=Tritrichomonas musculus TaxID=1915356 RepID=A0ABR2I815_9EUKA